MVVSEPLTRTLSTDTLRAEDRFAYWREIICDVFVQLDAEPVDGPGFEGRVTTTQLGAVEISTVAAGGQHVVRSPRQIAKTGSEEFLVSLQVKGIGEATQDGRRAPLRCGDFVLYDSTRPYELHFDAPFTQIVTQIPRARLDERCPGVDRLTGVRQSGDSALGRVVRGYLGSLVQGASRLEEESAHRLGETTIDVLAAAFAGALGKQEQLPVTAIRTLHLRRVKSYVESHLDDPALTPSAIAAATHISVRYLHDLFGAEEMTLTRWIWSQRLERCRQDLVDPRRLHRSVTDVAFSRGFRDAAHFSRCFKARYGVAPREYRLARCS